MRYSRAAYGEHRRPVLPRSSCTPTFGASGHSRREEVAVDYYRRFDIHRRQVTFDYLDTATGNVGRGGISSAWLAALRAWLTERFAGSYDMIFAVEGCTLDGIAEQKVPMLVGKGV